MVDESELVSVLVESLHENFKQSYQKQKKTLPTEIR